MTVVYRQLQQVQCFRLNVCMPWVFREQLPNDVVPAFPLLVVHFRNDPQHQFLAPSKAVWV